MLPDGFDPAATGHAVLETLVIRIHAAFGSEPADRIETMWGQLEDVLVRHFEDQERFLVAPLLTVRPREAGLVLHEHRYLRRRAALLRYTPQALTAAAVRAFLAEICAHARHEERMLSGWNVTTHPPGWAAPVTWRPPVLKASRGAH